MKEKTNYKMKKIYLEPETKVIMLHTVSAILVGSTGDAEGGNDDGSVIPSTGGDPTDPNWGKDY
jgi:hypothetical protein